MSALITSEQEVSLVRVAKDGARKAIKALKEEGVLTVEAAQRALGRGDELQGTIFDQLRELIQGKHPDEAVESDYTYPPEYQWPKPIEEQIEILRGLQFPMSRVPAVEIALPESAEGLFVVSRPEVIAPSDCDEPYRYGLEFVFERLASQRQFYNYMTGRLEPKYVREPERRTRILAQVSRQQEGDIFILPAQFGLGYRGCSVRQVRSLYGVNEFGLGAFHVGCMTLTHPERFVRWEQLHCDCDDEVSPGADGGFSHAPCFYWYDGLLRFYAHWVDRALEVYGLVSAFLPQ